MDAPAKGIGGEDTEGVKPLHTTAATAPLLWRSIVFTDKPCPVNSVTESVSETVFPASQAVEADQSKGKDAHIKNLDRLVDEAIGTGDLRLAKELALTSEHWAKIQMAETPKEKSRAQIHSEQADSEKCKMALRAYELQAGDTKQEPELIDAKKRSMYLACGMPEPNSVNVYNINTNNNFDANVNVNRKAVRLPNSSKRIQ